MNRRRFLAIAASGVAAATLAACGDGELSGVAPRITGGGSNRVTAKVSDYPALATIGQLVLLTNAPYAVKRTGTTTFDAFSIACTHDGCATNIVSNAFDCPCHGSKFDNNGAVTQGPAVASLQKLPTSYDQPTDTLTIN